MGTLKQLEKSYQTLVKARWKLSMALREAENVGLIKQPEYADGYWKRLNEIDNLIHNLSKDPLAIALQQKLRKDVYGY